MEYIPGPRYQIIIITTTSNAITKKNICLLFFWEKVFVRNNDEPHLMQTILPPKDLSETKLEQPQLIQNLSEFIIKVKNHFIPYKFYILLF